MPRQTYLPLLRSKYKTKYLEIEERMEKDNIFDNKLSKIKDFKFNQEVANVFDDMVSRSIPFYDEIHRIILDIARHHLGDNNTIIDLGCSTGTTIYLLETLLKKHKQNAHFIGIDNSQDMLNKCEEKLSKHKVRNFELLCQDLNQTELPKSNFVIMNYTLQFLSPSSRVTLLTKIFESLEKGSVFILTEKIKTNNKEVNNLLIDLYYDFKRRNGYSELEISQKREALENVLRPSTAEQNIELLQTAGFNKTETLFRWYNFACFIGIK